MLSTFIRRSPRRLFLGLALMVAAGPNAQFACAQGEVVRAHDEHTVDDSHSTAFGKVVQAGAKVMNRGGKVPPEKEIIDAEPKGSSSTADKKKAIAAIPFDRLSADHRERVQDISKNVSFYRRLPKVSFQVEPEVYRYFLAHPDVAVSVWRAMQISKLQMYQTGKTEYEADAGDGSVGAIEIAHSGVDKHLALCEGSFTSPILKNAIEARSFLLLQTSFITEPDGTVTVTQRGDLFISFPSQTIDVAAKVFSPLTVSLTDRTFTEVSMFVRMMSLAMSRRPDWVEQVVEKMDGVAEIRKTQLLDLTSNVHVEALQRATERAKQDAEIVSPESSNKKPQRLVEPAKSEIVSPKRQPVRAN